LSDPLDLFPGVPLIESPIFDSIVDRVDLTEDERRIAIDLNRKGFAAFDFPDPDLDERIARIRGRYSERFGLDDSDSDGPKLPNEGRVQDGWQDDEDVRAIACNARVIELLSKLWGRTAFPFQTLNFPVGTQQNPHTDTVHFSSVPERFMCGVWLAMEDIDAGSGPLLYYPGSHRWPVLGNMIIGRRGWQSELNSAQEPYEHAWAAMVAANRAETETFLARKGQALIWCANLLHGGSPRTDLTKTRWSQVTHYYFDDCIYYTPAFSDEPIGRLALREIVDVATGEPRPNCYFGNEVMPAKARPDPTQKGWIPKLRGRLFRI